jgi:hypothetical protein
MNVDWRHADFGLLICAWCSVWVVGYLKFSMKCGGTKARREDESTVMIET